jgi:hypothetical protein
VTRQRAAESRAYRVTRKWFGMLRSCLSSVFTLFLLLSSLSPLVAQPVASPSATVPLGEGFDTDPILDDFVYDFWIGVLVGIAVGSSGNMMACNWVRR